MGSGYPVWWQAVLWRLSHHQQICHHRRALCQGVRRYSIILHCSIFLLLRISERRIKLILGDHDRRHTDPAQETLTIETVFIRPDFVKKTFNNDLALIKLNREVRKRNMYQVLFKLHFRFNFLNRSGLSVCQPRIEVITGRTPPWLGGASLGRGGSQLMFSWMLQCLSLHGRNVGNRRGKVRKTIL